MKYLILPLLPLLASCWLPHRQDPMAVRIKHEYDWTRTPHYTAMGTHVIPPRWLAPEDIPKVVESVESYLTAMRELYPFSRNLRWGDITVYIHDALDKCVTTWGQWCNGWRSWDRVVVTWEPDAEGYPRRENPFAVLPHEMFHIVFDKQHEYSDGGHAVHFPGVRDIVAEIKRRAKPADLTEKSREAGNAFKYVPWNEKEGK